MRKYIIYIILATIAMFSIQSCTTRESDPVVLYHNIEQVDNQKTIVNILQYPSGNKVYDSSVYYVYSDGVLKLLSKSRIEYGATL